MKFGKKLRATVDSSCEEWRSQFLSYKDLKKVISASVAALSNRSSEEPDNDVDCFSKQGLASQNDTENSDQEPDPSPVTPEQRQQNQHAVQEAERTHGEFFRIFKHEVEKVNAFFLDKQEDFIIEHRQLATRVAQSVKPGAATRSEVNQLRRRLTNFHGELVLLENFSTVNYTGFRKILKKHDKKTGSNISRVYLRTVLVTPFFLSDTVRNLVLKTEQLFSQLDTITKFRRPNSPALTLDVPISCAPIVRRNTNTPIEPPRPHAFISLRSPLWPLHSQVRSFASALGNALSTDVPINLQPSPSQTLIDLVDRITPSELGLQSSFLNCVDQPSNYCISSDNSFSMGFFVYQPNNNLQLFKRHPHGASITTKLLCGRARLNIYQTVTTASASTVPSEHVLDGVEDKGFCVERKRTGTTIGPWPAVTVRTAETHLEWIPETVCAIFYVCAPGMAMDAMPTYRVEPHTAPTFRIVQEKREMKVVKVMC